MAEFGDPTRTPDCRSLVSRLDSLRLLPVHRLVAAGDDAGGGLTWLQFDDPRAEINDANGPGWIVNGAKRPQALDNRQRLGFRARRQHEREFIPAEPEGTIGGES